MAFLLFLLANLLLAFLGAFLVALADRSGKFSVLETWIYGYFAGILVSGIVFFLSGWAAAGFFWIKYLLLAATLALGGILWKSGRLAKLFRVSLPKWKMDGKRMLLAIPILLLLAFRIFFSLFQSLEVPSYFDDEKGNWNTKAKEIYYAGKIPVTNSEDPAYLGGGGHKEYPLNFILYKVYLADFLGKWSEPAANAVTLIVWVLTLVLVFRAFSDPLWGAIAAYVLSSIPLASWHAGIAYFDLMVAAFFLLALMNLSEYRKTGDTVRWFLIGLLLASAILTKNEGMVLVMPSIAAAVALVLFRKWRPKKSEIAWFFLPLAFILPNLAFRAVYKLSFNPHSTQAAYGFHSDSLNLYWTYFTSWGSYNVFWYALPVVLILTWKFWKKDENAPVGAALVALVAIIFLVFSFTNNYQFLLDQTTINRTLLIFMVPFSYFSVRGISEKLA
jgi:hypothetical protein